MQKNSLHQIPCKHITYEEIYSIDQTNFMNKKPLNFNKRKSSLVNYKTTINEV